MMASLNKLKVVENLPADAEEIVTRLSNELMQARDELAEVEQLRRKLHHERVRRDEWEKMYNRLIAGTKVEQLQKRLGQVKTALNNEVDSRVSAKLEVEQLRAKLVQAQSEAARLGTALADACATRNALARECNELEEAREYNARLVEERDRELAHIQRQLAAVQSAIKWLWGYYDGCSLRAIPGFEDDIRDAWDKLLTAADLTDDAIKLQERLTKLDTTEAALADCGISGIYDEFSSPADAIEQMVKRLVHLESSQALQAERQLRREAERRAKQAEALAALVTLKLAELLEHLAYGVGNIATDEGAIEAFALAAHIREVL